MTVELIGQSETDDIIEAMVQQSSFTDGLKTMMTKKYEKFSHEEIAEMLAKREADLRIEIDKLYAQVGEVRRMRDNLWREVGE